MANLILLAVRELRYGRGGFVPRAKDIMSKPAHSPAAGCSEEPVVDLAHLTSFTEGDVQLESELAALYISSAEVYLERMAEALASGGSWSGPAHALKGASSNLGVRRIAALAQAAEHAAPNSGQMQAIRSALDEVRAFFAARRVR